MESPGRSSIVVAAVLCLCASLTASAARARPGAASAPIALGVSVSDPGKPSGLQQYVSSVGRKPALVMWFQSFDEPLYYRDQLAAVHALGAIPMITWEPAHGAAGIPLRSIAAGADDGYIRRAAAAARAWGRPLFIRFAHEMNVTSSPWGPGMDGNTPDDYVRAWRHVVSIFRQAGAANVRWVWSPNVDCGGRCPFDAYYPGDAWVDWVALDGYNYGPVDRMPWLSMAQIFGSSYRTITTLTKKPLMIAETGSTESGGDKATWITRNLLTDIPRYLPRVRAVVWFERVGETNWRVDSSPASLAAFRAVAASPLYAAASASLVGATRAPVGVRGSS